MTFKSYLTNLFGSTIFVFIVLVSFVFFTNPDDFALGSSLAFIIFYLLFFLVMTGLSVLILTWLWRKMSGNNLAVEELGMAVRQGGLIGILMTILLFFQQMGILIWWDALLIMGAILLVEFYFLSRE
jgi:hypothetical protein